MLLWPWTLCGAAQSQVGVDMGDIKRTVSEIVISSLMDHYPNVNKDEISIKMTFKQVKPSIRNKDALALDDSRALLDLAARSASYRVKHDHIRSFLGKSSMPIYFQGEDGADLGSSECHLVVEATGWFMQTVSVIEKDHAIQPGQVIPVLRQLYGKPTNIFSSEKELVGKIAQHRLPKNRLITTSMVRSVYDITKNQKVMVVYEKQGVTLQLSGIAMEDGYIGGVIPVKLLMGEQKIVKGAVHESGIVRYISNY